MKKILFLIIILVTAKNLKAQNSNFNWVNTYKGGDSEGKSVAIDNQGFIYTTGQILLSEVPANVLHTLHLENFANGIYYVNIYQNNHIVKREKIVLNK